MILAAYGFILYSSDITGEIMVDYILPVLTAFLGLTLLFIPQQIVVVIVIAIGIYLICSGFFIMFKVARLLDEKFFRANIYIRSLISVVIGILCIALPLQVGETIYNAICIMLGIYTVLAAISELISIVKLRQNSISVKKYVPELIGTIISAFIFFLLPKVGYILLRIAGGISIVIAIINAIQIKKNQPIIQADAQVVDEEDVSEDDEAYEEDVNADDEEEDK